MRFRRALHTPGYLVLGMHRSGTSCLTGLLETAGLTPGAVSRRNKHNAKGNLEDRSIRAVNSAILKRFGGSWKRPPTHIAWSEIPRRPIYAALDAYRGQEGWVIKEPRMLLTLPAWLPHLRNCRFVGTFRHPLSVACSMHARDAMPLEDGVALWTTYNQRLIELHARLPFPLLRFDQPKADYLAQFAALCASEGLRFSRDLCESFYDGALVHASSGDADALPQQAAETLAYLVEHQVPVSAAATG